MFHPASSPGGYSITFYTGRLRPEVQPRPFLYSETSIKRKPLGPGGPGPSGNSHASVPLIEVYKNCAMFVSD